MIFNLAAREAAPRPTQALPTVEEDERRLILRAPGADGGILAGPKGAYLFGCQKLLPTVCQLALNPDRRFPLHSPKNQPIIQKECLIPSL